MRRGIVSTGIFVFIVFFAVNSFSEINLSQSNGKLKVVGLKKTARLDAKTTEATVKDLTGGNANVAYDAATGAVDIKAIDKAVGFTYSIAKIYLDMNKSARVAPGAGFGGFNILNTSPEGNIIVTFPDMSRISMPKDAQVSFTKLADNNYYMKVVSGAIEYRDSQGKSQTLTSSSPEMLVQGFGVVPGWRSSELQEDHPATP